MSDISVTCSQPPVKAPVLETVATMNEANPSGDIFGGWMLAQMDLAGGCVAFSYASNRVVTAGVTDVNFHKPVFVGDRVKFYAEIAHIGRTSIRVNVHCWVARRNNGPLEKVTDAFYTYVSVDENLRPQPVIQTSLKGQKND
jgi:acyl-CoA thioesterase YciA